MLYTDFPDQFDPDAVQVIWDVFKGEPFDKRRAALAALNVTGYLLGRFTSMSGPLMAASADAPVPQGEAADAVFQAALEAAKNPQSTDLALGVPFWVGPFIQMIIKVVLPLILKK